MPCNSPRRECHANFVVPRARESRPQCRADHWHTPVVSERLWVARLHISERTAQKITSVHHITSQEVRDAVELRTGLTYVWDEHPERGRRALVETPIRGRRTIVVLYPVAGAPLGDEYHLGSAYPDRS